MKSVGSGQSAPRSAAERPLAARHGQGRSRGQCGGAGELLPHCRMAIPGHRRALLGALWPDPTDFMNNYHFFFSKAI